jgi:hypothetical protein
MLGMKILPEDHDKVRNTSRPRFDPNQHQALQKPQGLTFAPGFAMEKEQLRLHNRPKE